MPILLSSFTALWPWASSTSLWMQGKHSTLPGAAPKSFSPSHSHLREEEEKKKKKRHPYSQPVLQIKNLDFLLCIIPHLQSIQRLPRRDQKRYTMDLFIPIPTTQIRVTIMSLLLSNLSSNSAALTSSLHKASWVIVLSCKSNCIIIPLFEDSPVAVIWT